MNNILKVKQTVPYDLKKRKVLQSRNPSSVRYGTERNVLQSRNRSSVRYDIEI